MVRYGRRKAGNYTDSGFPKYFQAFQDALKGNALFTRASTLLRLGSAVGQQAAGSALVVAGHSIKATGRTWLLGPHTLVCWAVVECTRSCPTFLPLDIQPSPDPPQTLPNSPVQATTVTPMKPVSPMASFYLLFKPHVRGGAVSACASCGSAAAGAIC